MLLISFTIVFFSNCSGQEHIVSKIEKKIFQRPVGRGGGVGFFIADDIGFKILQQNSIFIPNSFESLTIEARVGVKTYVFSSVYRSLPPSTSTPSLRT
jgi:hypothetical protein